MTPRGFDPRPTARAFWDKVRKPEPFPRQLRGAIAEVLPVGVVSLPRLTLAAVADWLQHRGSVSIRLGPDRALCGCLVAQRGHGFIFLDGMMDANDERLTLVL